MCGIIGYIGEKEAQPILLDCLAHLEYRGYDSCGFAVDGKRIAVCKDAVRVAELKRRKTRLRGTAGIGHTRWATHGTPTAENAHPHSNDQGDITVVHNGVIDNHLELRGKLAAAGHTFNSDTDTEIIPHLISHYYQGDLEQALKRALADVRGSYAIIVLRHQDDRLLAVRRESPLVIGLGDRENFVASDVPAIIGYTSRVLYPEDGDICAITRGEVAVSRNGRKVELAEQKITWDAEDARKGGYEHFMLKEIHEQPRVIRDTVGSVSAVDEAAAEQYRIAGICDGPLLLLACGTSYHASLVAKYLGEELLGVPVRVELASEFSHYSSPLSSGTTVAVTQSGETADILNAMHRIKESGGELITVNNVVASSASRMADRTIHTRAGPEISVAATKSFTAQLAALYLIILTNAVSEERRLAELRTEMRQLSSRVQQVLDNESRIEAVAARLAGYENAFFIGRGINYPIALEGALKCKEISYIHAEGYAAGELKHGTFALLGTETPVVAILMPDGTYEPMLTTIKEVKARSSPIIALAREDDENIGQLADEIITVPEVSPLFTPVVNTVALQLLAYHTALRRGCPIDFPRNLAKSVTVE